MGDPVKVTLNITKENYDAVEKLAERMGINKTSVINLAIKTEKYLSDAISEGKKILTRDEKGNFQEIFFR